uniref:Ionotropic glutamate receptor L-glutamate and glycine-binding domain-containing protein n=1 Tax=Timema poppense TaxID=170557 RepID=A0A7R9HGN6_TIMPO|nr:unnamed protein product [Timema poppensis]
MKEIIYRKADLGICDFTITYDRGKAVDFTMPFLNTDVDPGGCVYMVFSNRRLQFIRNLFKAEVE